MDQLQIQEDWSKAGVEPGRQEVAIAIVHVDLEEEREERPGWGQLMESEPRENSAAFRTSGPPGMDDSIMQSPMLLGEHPGIQDVFGPKAS